MKAPRFGPEGSSVMVLACAMGLLANPGAAEVRINLDQPPAATKQPAGPKRTAQPALIPATKSSPAKPVKKAEPPPKIEGMEVARGDRGFLGVMIQDGVFRITFYDHDKKLIPPDVAEAVLRWPVHYQPNDERTLLTPSSDGKALTSEKIVRAPYSFKLFLTLLKTPDAAAETYVIDFRQ